MRYLTADEVCSIADFPRAAFDRAASSWLPKKLRVKVGPVYEYVPVTPAFLKLVALLRGTFGESSRIPAQLAEQALPQIERLLTSSHAPSDSLTIQASPTTQVDIRSSFVAEVREALAQLS